ncbi:hypothetical protein [Corynebacterium callunae]|uniref:Uncharacterized protein n=1 Tax=Corynebacterium callunae DSM 20147 TaxID=1121353 RepID=M1UP70_9CORY|nr:hypothetical protein H924_13400 [Corynebacterium callunae DSM 20147]
MILESDVTSTYKAYKPQAPQEEITALFEEIREVELHRRSYWEEELKKAWMKANRGEQPGFLETLAILDQAAQHAEMQVRGEYLEPLTQQIVQQQLENEEAEETAKTERSHQEALADPDLWWQEPWRIQPSDDAKDLAEWLWPESTTTFAILADNLLTLRQLHDLPLPWQFLDGIVDTSDPLYQELTTQIAAAEIRSNNLKAQRQENISRYRQQQNQQ